jgi:hypothetical protein
MAVSRRARSFGLSSKIHFFAAIYNHGRIKGETTPGFVVSVTNWTYASAAVNVDVRVSSIAVRAYSRKEGSSLL